MIWKPMGIAPRGQKLLFKCLFKARNAADGYAYVDGWLDAGTGVLCHYYQFAITPIGWEWPEHELQSTLEDML